VFEPRPARPPAMSKASGQWPPPKRFGRPARPTLASHHAVVFSATETWGPLTARLENGADSPPWRPLLFSSAFALSIQDRSGADPPEPSMLPDITAVDEADSPGDMRRHRTPLRIVDRIGRPPLRPKVPLRLSPSGFDDDILDQ